VLSRVGVLATILFGLSGTSSFRFQAQSLPPVFDVRAYGAKGDGKSVDTGAINAAVGAASAAGGGIVFLPAGRYLSFSIRLASHISLQFAPGAVLVAGDPTTDNGRYDAPEPNPSDFYQDFGHSHWQNSLIWGIDVEDVSIVGPGLIDGRGLTRRGPGARWTRAGGDRPLSMGAAVGGAADPEAVQRSMDGQGNKAIALKRSRNVTLRDFAILNGGHFALLATGVDTLTIDNVRIDTNRDGFDIDASRNVRISNVAVNSPNDDAIVLKSSYALGEARPTENVTITNSQVSGFDIGTMLDGTFKHTQERAPDRDGVTGRIKLGTESNGGFRNITISNCVFEWSRGLAIETVDGGLLEDVTVTNLTMRHVTTAPIFLRLGNRGRGPVGTPVGALRRVTISNIVASDVEARYAAIVAGLPGHPIEDVLLSNIRLVYRGGVAAARTAAVPEHEDAYPEPSMFGTTPAYGLYVRHAKNVTARDLDFQAMSPDARPPVALVDVDGFYSDHMVASRSAGGAFFALENVRQLAVRGTPGVPDFARPRLAGRELVPAR
jgi:polygalacturonase